MGRKGWTVVCAALICVALVAVNVMADEDRGEGRRVAPGRARGNIAKARPDRAVARGPGMRWGLALGGLYRAMASEEAKKAIKEEFERHGKIMKGLQEEVKELRKEIREVVKELRGGDERGRPGREEVEAVTAEYEGEAKKIATSMVDERLKHRANVTSIINSHKSDAIDALTKVILHPRRFRGRGRPRGRGEGDGDKETGDEGKEEKPLRGRMIRMKKAPGPAKDERDPDNFGDDLMFF